jgi:hypothetical protein
MTDPTPTSTYCDGTGFADYAAVPCRAPDYPVTDQQAMARLTALTEEMRLYDTSPQPCYCGRVGCRHHPKEVS